MLLATGHTSAWLVAGVAVIGLVGTLAGAFVGPLLTAKATAKREQDARHDAARAAADERQLATLLELQEAISRLLITGRAWLVKGAILREATGGPDFGEASARVTELTQRVRSSAVRKMVADVGAEAFEMATLDLNELQGKTAVVNGILVSLS